MSQPTTTLDAIRDDMVRIVRDLVPKSLNGTRFVPEREELDFVAWADDNPQAAFRKFAIGDSFTEEIPEVFLTESWDDAIVSILVAYPKTLALYGQGRSSMRSVIREDRNQLKDNLGDAGYGNFVEPAAIVLDGTSVVEADTVMILGVDLRVRYWRDVIGGPGFGP